MGHCRTSATENLPVEERGLLTIPIFAVSVWLGGRLDNAASFEGDRGTDVALGYRLLRLRNSYAAIFLVDDVCLTRVGRKRRNSPCFWLTFQRLLNYGKENRRHGAGCAGS